jgi:uncharacterized protein
MVNSKNIIYTTTIVMYHTNLPFFKLLLKYFFVFWVLAFSISKLLVWIIPQDLAQIIYPGLNVFSYGMGPMFAVVVLYLFTINTQSSFFTYPFLGTGKKYKAILFYIIPIIAMVIFSEGKYWNSFLIGLSIMLYCLFEEIGWRGFVLKLLENFDFYVRTIVTYIMWLSWHLSFQAINWQFALVVFVGNFFINLTTRKTQSILVAATMHAVANIIEYSPKALLICIPVWFVMFRLWDKENINKPKVKFLDSI